MDDLPDGLHHYTDAAGLMGIVESKSLWATDCRFLNDSSEYQLGLEIVTVGLQDMRNPALDPAHHLHQYAEEAGDDYRALSEIVQHELITNDLAFVACFCESGDLLSQWRGYSRRHGYSIEFDPISLRASVEACQGSESPGTLTRVEYDTQRAGDAAGAAVAAVGSDSLNHPGVHGYHLALTLAAEVARIKNPGFSEEREWRAIVVHYQAPGTAPSEEVQFRPTGLAIVPFVRIGIDLSCIRALTVGPGPEQAVRVEGVKRWLWSHEVYAEVLTSEIPYRP